MDDNFNDELVRCIELQGFVPIPFVLRETALNVPARQPDSGLPESESERWVLLQEFVQLP